MALKIRLRRMGAIKQPSYRVVVTEARTPRDGSFVEIIGHYNPLTQPATIRIDADRVKYWMERGAQPTDTVTRLLKSAGAAASSEATPSASSSQARETETTETSQG